MAASASPGTVLVCQLTGPAVTSSWQCSPHATSWQAAYLCCSSSTRVSGCLCDVAGGGEVWQVVGT